MFFVSVERRIHPQLQGKPLLVGGISDRGVVAACSYETRGYGIHSGMPMKMAKELCPEATVIRGNSGTYTKVSDEVTEIIKEAVPVFEKSSIDEFYADLSGMDKFFGSYKYATELRRKIIKDIRQVKNIQEMPMDIMQQVLGANGRLIWKRANGLDNSN